MIGKTLLLATALLGAINTTNEAEEPETNEGEDENVEETITQKIKDALSQYLDEQSIANIVNWCIDSGLIAFASAVYLKYRKYKAKSSEEIANEVKAKIEKELEKSFKNLSNDSLTQLVDKIGGVEKTIKVLEKALILAQDKTAEGKIALINLITDNNEETKNEAETVVEEIKKEEAVVEEVKETVASDYTPID